MDSPNVTMTGWRAAWVERTLPAFQTYAFSANLVLALAMSTVAIISIIRNSRLTKGIKIATSTSERAVLLKELKIRVSKTCKAHYVISWLYLLNFFGIWGVDTYVSVSLLEKGVSEHPEAFTGNFLWMFLAACLSIAAVFMAAFILVPLAQMLLATWALNRFAKKSGNVSLAEYIPEARLYSTQIAQIWSMFCFLIMVYWPVLEKSALRWIVLEACVGSASAWLDASYAFLFKADKLAEIKLGNSRVAEIVKMFATTAKAVHVSEKNAGDVLPRYQDVPTPESTSLLDEKTPELAAEDELSR